MITFAQITDPETLVTVIQVLKDRYSAITTSDPSKTTNSKCNKCGNDEISNRSKFCSLCGSQLSTINSIFDDSVYSKEEGEEMIPSREFDVFGRYENLRKRIDDYKPYWDKDGVIQYKTEYIAILKRIIGMQVEFIIAFDDLTREGYRLMTEDEGVSGGDSAGGFVGGMSAYFYFQKMKYVK